jgi:L-ribulose-5-phosphate 3-epimerase UlaE
MLFPTIKKECSQFIRNSNGNPLFKSLPSGKDAFIRVKARHRKMHDDSFENAFNSAFQKQTNKIFSKAIFCNTNEVILPNHENYYVFPIDGYRILYSKNDKNTSKTYQTALAEILDMVAENHAVSLLTTILSDDYTDENLSEALLHKKEILIYNIPYFFAIKCSLFPSIADYKNIIYK